MAISVIKGHDSYHIRCSVDELEQIRRCMRIAECYSQQALTNNPKWREAIVVFSDECATIINNALVANGD